MSIKSLRRPAGSGQGPHLLIGVLIGYSLTTE
jgi:hypothetical protein